MASEKIRKLGKRTFNRLLNARSNSSRTKLSLKSFPEDVALLPDEFNFDEYVAALIEHNQCIAQWFGSDEGAKLQYEDSEIALSILKNLAVANVPTLPIHDSFIVEYNHEEQLRSTMSEVFQNRFGTLPIIH
jgi:hypothetical protein